MTSATVSALTCPACGGPLTSQSFSRCRFCGVALIVPLVDGESFADGDPAAIHGEIGRLREQLRLDPTRSGTHRRLGQAYQALGLTDDAVRALTVGVGLAPEVIAPRLELATLLARQSATGVPDAFPAAIRHVRQVLALEPESIDGRLLFARLLTQRGRYGEARTTLSGIVRLPLEEVRRRSAWVSLAEAADHERRGHRRGAVAAWRRVAVEAPDLVRPAVASFLVRTPVLGTPAQTQRSVSQRVQLGALIIIVTVVSGLTLGLPWPVLVAIVGLAVLAGGLVRLKRGKSGAPRWRSRPLPQPLSGSPAPPGSPAEAASAPQVPAEGSTPLHQKQVLLAHNPKPPDRQRTIGRPGSARPEADLARMLREADRVAVRADLASRQGQIDWADNLTVALPPR